MPHIRRNLNLLKIAFAIWDRVAWVGGGDIGIGLHRYENTLLTLAFHYFLQIMSLNISLPMYVGS